MHRIVVPLLVAIVCCGQPAHGHTDVPTPARKAGTPLESRSPAVGFSCRLPVAGLGQTGQGGFIRFPEATFTPDPASEVSYDAAAHRWLPVAASLIAPDGRSYVQSATVSASTELRLVEAMSGRSRVVWSGDGNWSAIGYAPGLAYMLRTYPPIHRYASSTHQIYMLDLKSSDRSPKLVGPPSPSQWTTWGPSKGGAIWGIDVGSPPSLQPDPTPSSGIRIDMDTAIRMDLTTGAIQRFVTMRGLDLYLLGFDSAERPIVAMRGYSTPINRIGVITSPDSMTDLVLGSEPGFEPRSARSDQHGVWFDTQDGQSIWLYDATHGLRSVFRFPQPTPRPIPSESGPVGLGGPFVGSPARVLAGPCV